MKRTGRSTVFSAGIIFFAIVVTIASPNARASPAVPSLVVTRSNSDDGAMADELSLADCVSLVIEGTDCESDDVASEVAAMSQQDVFVEIMINDAVQYNDSLDKYCQLVAAGRANDEPGNDRSDRSASSSVRSILRNNCPDIPYVLQSPKGCGFAASNIEDEGFTVRFYDPDDDDEDSESMLCTSNISKEVIRNITKSKAGSFL